MQKRSFFSWRCPFQRKLLFFQTIESAKHAFAASAGSRKFLENEKQNSRKNYRAMFSRYVQGHMQKLSSFGQGKKICLKSHISACCTKPFICKLANFVCDTLETTMSTIIVGTLYLSPSPPMLVSKISGQN